MFTETSTKDIHKTMAPSTTPSTQEILETILAHENRVKELLADMASSSNRTTLNTLSSAMLEVWVRHVSRAAGEGRQLSQQTESEDIFGAASSYQDLGADVLRIMAKSHSDVVSRHVLLMWQRYHGDI